MLVGYVLKMTTIIHTFRVVYEMILYAEMSSTGELGTSSLTFISNVSVGINSPELLL